MNTKKGFTLIEIIITIVILAIAAAMMMAVFGRQFSGSAIPAGQVQSQYRLIQQMELITSQYRDQITTNASFTLAAFKKDYIDGKDYVDSTKTGTVQDLAYGAKKTQPYLRVTLTDGNQSIMSIFTY